MKYLDKIKFIPGCKYRVDFKPFRGRWFGINFKTFDKALAFCKKFSFLLDTREKMFTINIINDNAKDFNSEEFIGKTILEMRELLIPYADNRYIAIASDFSEVYFESMHIGAYCAVYDFEYIEGGYSQEDFAGLYGIDTITNDRHENMFIFCSDEYFSIGQYRRPDEIYTKGKDIYLSILPIHFDYHIDIGYPLSAVPVSLIKKYIGKEIFSYTRDIELKIYFEIFNYFYYQMWSDYGHLIDIDDSHIIVDIGSKIRPIYATVVFYEEDVEQYKEWYRNNIK